LAARIFKVDLAGSEHALRVPLWFWNSAEWTSFAQASLKTQRPTLIEALRIVRDGQSEAVVDTSHELRRFLRTMLAIIRVEKNAGSPWGSFPKPKSFFEKLEKWKTGLEPELAALAGAEATALDNLLRYLNQLGAPRRVQHPHYDFTRQEINTLLERVSSAHAAFGGADSDTLPVDVDSPRPFAGDALLRGVEAAAEIMGVSEHVETLLIRLKGLLADTQMRAVIGEYGDLTLERWLTDYVGGDEARDGCLTVIDLSLVPSEIVHIVTAVTARMIFEALQRYRKLNGVTLPTVLVMEEAHTFIKRYKEDVENYPAAAICCQVFERIAREGRKFGLGLVISSQRPSELSQTVLSQCNSFLLHRISNDRDQDLVKQLVPDNLRGLLRELPSLPSQHAILLGWASELPVLVKMDDLPKSQQPHSDDPDFWNVWTGKDSNGAPVIRKVDWKPIVDDWQGIHESAESGEHVDDPPREP